MNNNLEIEHGSQADNIGQSLVQDLSDTGTGMAISAVSGGADVIASTGINVGVGSTDLIIADNIAAGLNLMGELGLTNLAGNLESYTLNLAAMGLNAPEELVQLLLEQLEAILCQGGVLDAILTGLKVAANTTDMAKKGLDYAVMGATMIANLLKLLLKLNKFLDVDVMCVPSVKESTSMLAASFINLVTAQYEALKQQLILFYNSMICTSNDAVLDNVVMSVNNILEVTEPLIDPILQQYTGHTVSEIRMICNTGFALVGMIERSAAAKRKLKEEEEAQENIESVESEDAIEETPTETNDSSNNLGDEIEEGIKKIGSSVDAELKNLAESEKEKFKKERIEKAKAKWKAKTQDLSKEKAKEKLLEWLSKQSIMIQNAFHLLIIKDTIEHIKVFLSQLLNTSIENLADLLNMLSDIIEIFEMLGIRPGAKGITMEDLKAIGMGLAGTVGAAAIDAAYLVQDAAAQATQDMINSSIASLNESGQSVLNEDVIGSAKANMGVAANLVYGDLVDINGNSISSASSAATNELNNNVNISEDGKDTSVSIQKATAMDIAAGLADKGINDIIDAGLNINLAESGSDQLKDAVNNLKSSLNADGIKPPFIYSLSTENKTITINVTLLKNPRLNLIKITSFIKSFKSGSDLIFNNGVIKEIKDAFYDVWDTGEPIELQVKGKVDGITKIYIFNIEVDLEERNNPENNTDEILDDGIDTEGLSNSAATKVTGIAGNAGSAASNIVNNQLDSLENSADVALSKFTQVDVNLDMTAIEALLKDKVLIFDPILSILKALIPLIDVLKVICHLLQNYLINKEFANSGALVELSSTIRLASLFVNGLKDTFNLNDTNFFIVRTEKLANWIQDNDFLGGTIDEDGFLVVNLIQTNKLRLYCEMNFITPDAPLNLLKGTTLYYDLWAIKTGGYQDGTSNGVDNMEIDRNAGIVYYDKKRRSIISSQILRARKNNVDPYYKETKQPEETKTDIASLLKSTEFSSDEMEGLQTLDMCNVYLCPPANTLFANAEEPLNSAVIVEFGEEYTKGNEVQYSLKVKPGQTIKQGNIIAYITKNGKLIPVLTKFEGIVRSVNNDTDFYHLYPTTANRHFIIDNYKPCMPVNYKFEDILDFLKKFKKTIELESLIINCLPSSVLPTLLLNANRDNKEVVPPNFLVNLTDNANNQLSSSGALSKFENIVKDYNTQVNTLSSAIKELSKNVNSSLSDNNSFKVSNSSLNYTKVSTENYEQLKDSMLQIRKQIVNAAISAYEKQAKSASVYGDYTYSDCIGLAYSQDKSFNIGDGIEYNNYYINLLKIIPESKDADENITIEPINLNMSKINEKLSKIGSKISIGNNTSIGMFVESSGQYFVEKSDFYTIRNIKNNITEKIAGIRESMNSISGMTINTKDEGRNFVKEYKSLIKQIVDRRLSYEELDTNIQSLKDYFTSYYNEHIMGIVSNQNAGMMGIVQTKVPITDAYEYLYNKVDHSLKDNEFENAIKNQIKFDKLEKVYDLNDIIDASNFRNDLKTYSEDNEQYYDEIENAFTLFIYIYHKNVQIYESAPVEISNLLFKRTSANYSSLKTITDVLANQYISNTKQITYEKYKYNNFWKLYLAVLTNANAKVKNNKDIDPNLLAIIDLTSILNADKETIEYLVESYKIINSQSEDISISSDALIYFNREINKYYFDVLLKTEAREIEQFWDEVLDAYRTEYNIDKIISEIQGYADNMNSTAQWPQSVNIQVKNTNYELYTFMDPYEDKKDEVKEVPYTNEIPKDFEIPKATIDLTNLPDPMDNSDITIFDYQYWLVYMLNATLFTLISAYWSDGLDIPPFMVPTPLPALYFPIAPPIMVPVVNVLFVFGIALRGIWPAPIILMINLSSDDIDAMIIIKIALEIAKDIFKKSLELVENGIPMILNEMVKKYISENEIAQKAIDKFRTYTSIIRAIPVEDKALIEKKFNEALYLALLENEKLNNASQILQSTLANIAEKGKLANEHVDEHITAAYEGMQKGIYDMGENYLEAWNSTIEAELKRKQEREKRKLERANKKLDTRQVVTREEDLGNGPEPM